MKEWTHGGGEAERERESERERKREYLGPETERERLSCLTDRGRDLERGKDRQTDSVAPERMENDRRRISWLESRKRLSERAGQTEKLPCSRESRGSGPARESWTDRKTSWLQGEWEKRPCEGE